MVLFSLEKKRLRGSLINVYKCLVLGLKQKELGSSQWEMSQLDKLKHLFGNST